MSSGFPFVFPFASSQILSFGGFMDAVVVATSSAPVGAWIPPTSFTIEQFQFMTPNAIVGAGTITGQLVSFDVNTGALTLLGTIVLDATHPTGTVILSTPVTPQISLAVLVSGGGGLAGGHLVITGVSGSIAS